VDGTVNDRDCTLFLQWALPRINLSWPGFRKVRRQVCKRLRARMAELHIESFQEYRACLEREPAEWRAFDGCCHITISRFFRDRGVFEIVRRILLPEIAARAKSEGRAVQIWSAGCASGEEPYTLKILWDFEIAPGYPDVPVSIVATDIDDAMLTRAREACFKPSSLHELPCSLFERAFERKGLLFCVRATHRQGVTFAHQDLRLEMPSLHFDLVLCRYVAFTYFSPALREAVATGISDHLLPNGYLVIGTHEQLPAGTSTLVPVANSRQVFRRVQRQEVQSGLHPVWMTPT
jgi:chemotaxis protein methyltransferase CheR